MFLPQVVFSSYYPYHLLPLEEVFDVFGCLPRGARLAGPGPRRVSGVAW